MFTSGNVLCYNERTDCYGVAAGERSLKLAQAGLLAIMNALIVTALPQGSVH